jgi:hypothetical protein
MRGSQTIIVAAASLLASVTSAGGASAMDTIRPGYWESTNKVTTPINSTKTERRCITPEAVDKFMGCYINHHYTCACPAQSYSGGKISFHGDCVDAKKRHVLIDGEGAYTETTLKMTASGHFNVLGGLSIPFSAATDAHRIGDVCPAGAPGSARDGR